jgi:hypothetical protein
MPSPFDLEKLEMLETPRRRQRKLSVDDQADIALTTDPTTSLYTLEDNPAVVVRIEDAWDGSFRSASQGGFGQKTKTSSGGLMGRALVSYLRSLVKRMLGGDPVEPPVIILDEFDHHDPLYWDKLGQEPASLGTNRSIVIGIDQHGNEYVVPTDS